MSRREAKTINLGAYYLYLDEKSPYWQCRASDPKKAPLWKSTKCRDGELAKAKTRAKEIYRDWAKAKKLQPGEKILFCDLWSEFMEHKEQTVEWITYDRVRQIGELHLLPYFAHKFLDEVPKLWPRWLAAVRKARPTSPLFNERKYIVNAFKFAYEQEYIDRIPSFTVPIKPGKPGKVYTDAEIRRLLEHAAGNESMLLQVLMGLTMGMRHGEICYLELDRIDLVTKTITLGERDTKTRRARTIRMSEEVLSVIEPRVRRLKGTTPWLFPQKGNPMQVQAMQARDARWSDLKRTAKVTGRFHDLRHSCATRLARSGVPAEVACAYLGMSLKVYDAVYCHLGVDDTAIAAGVVELPSGIPSVRGVIRGLKVENPAND